MNYKITQHKESKEIKINFYKGINNIHVKITNFMGMIFLNEEVTKSEISVSLNNQQNSVYFIQITIDKVTTVEKVIF